MIQKTVEALYTSLREAFLDDKSAEVRVYPEEVLINFGSWGLSVTDFYRGWDPEGLPNNRLSVALVLYSTKDQTFDKLPEVPFGGVEVFESWTQRQKQNNRVCLRSYESGKIFGPSEETLKLLTGTMYPHFDCIDRAVRRGLSPVSVNMMDSLVNE